MAVDFVGLAEHCTTAEEFEQEVLAHLARSIGCDAAFFLVKGNEHAFSTFGLDAKLRSLMHRRGATYAQELLPVKRAALAARGVAVDTAVCGITNVRKAKYYREVVQQAGAQHSLMAYVPWRGRVVAALMLGRSSGKGFAAHELEQVEASLPTLAVTRAVYGLPPTFEPLPEAPVQSLRSAFGLPHKLGFGRGARVLATTPTAWGTLTVRDRAGFREMVANDGKSELVWTRVALDDSTRSGWPYVELLHLAPALAKQRTSALFIGSGGAVALRQWARAYPGIAIDVVERDPAVIDLARAYFDLEAIPNLRVFIADGSAFVRSAAAAAWDIVVIDAYDASTFDAEFAAPHFLAALHRGLRPGGAVACNVIGTLTGSSAVQSFVAAARATFDDVRSVPVVELGERYWGETLRNVVVVATRHD